MAISKHVSYEQDPYCVNLLPHSTEFNKLLTLKLLGEQLARMVASTGSLPTALSYDLHGAHDLLLGSFLSCRYLAIQFHLPTVLLHAISFLWSVIRLGQSFSISTYQRASALMYANE